MTEANGTGHVLMDDLTFDTVPDPGSTLLLLGMSLVGLGAARRRK